MTSMAQSVGPSYFYEDEVYRIGKSGDVEFGMVTENWEMYSSSDDEDNLHGDKVLPGHVCISWYPKGKEEVLPESKVKLSARSLMPGDVVRRLIAGKDTQRGYCRSVKVKAAVQVIGTRKVIPNVSASDLVPVQKLTPEVAVYLDTWIGVVRDMKYRLRLKFADNSTCAIDSTLIMEHFEDIRRGFDSFSSSDVFYPGQKLRGPMRFLKGADWTYCSDDVKRAKDRKQVTVIVTEVIPSAMNVQWQWQTPECPLESPPENIEWQKNPPPETVKGEVLKRVKTLNLFESCTVQLGDISYYTPRSSDTILEKTTWKKTLPTNEKETTNLSLASRDGRRNADEATPSDIRSANTEPVTAQHELKIDDLNSKPEEGVPEKNTDALGNEMDEENNLSNVTKGIPASSNKRTLPRLSTKALRKKKLKKARAPPIAPPSIVQSLASQVVVETVHTRALVDVVWQDGTYEEEISSVELYPIHHLDDHEFFPGDFVIRADSSDPRTYGVIQKMDHAERVAVVKWFEAYSYAGEQKPKELEETEMSVFDIKDHPDFRFRPGTIVIRVANLTGQSCGAGQIMDNYPDGQVRVWWANATVTACWPQDLFRLGEYDSDEGEIWDDGAANSDICEGEDDDDAASDSSWVTEAEEELNESQSGPECMNRYLQIGKLIEKIQKTLVMTRETIVASGSVSIENGVPDSPSVAKLVNNEQPSLTKKLLLIYKDCQYLDKMMETKFFDVDDLKNWYRGKESVSTKSRRMIEQISRMFDIPAAADGKTTLRRLSSGSDYQLCAKTSVDHHSENNPSITHESQSQLSSEGNTHSSVTSEGKINEDNSSPHASSATPNFLSYELCSIILNKLLKVHSEYQKRFGSGIILSEEINSVFPVELEEIKDCSGAGEDLLNKNHDAIMAAAQTVPASTVGNDSALASLSPLISSQTTVIAPGSDPVCPPNDKLVIGNGSSYCQFAMMESVPDTHRYRLTSLQPQNQKSFMKAVQKEVSLMRESLPDGIFVKAYEDRMDLFSVMICGPEKTPYEDGIFFFDIQLPSTYPSTPPLVHYVSFCTDRLNPNLYEEGKVCVSLLGTWSGKGTEVWTPNSSILQVLVSIQGLILVPEPYYNEAGYEKQRGSQQGMENSRMYNEMVLIKLVQSMSRMLVNPPAPWEQEAVTHIRKRGPRMIERCRKWLIVSESGDINARPASDLPEFPLLPVSKGFSITLKKTLDNFAKLCASTQPAV